jgi:colicin import membrane protein
MMHMFSRKLLLAAAIALAAGLVVGNSPTSIGQEKEKSGTKEKKKGRLPAYYGDLSVTDAQRQQIYAVQESFAKKIDVLQQQVDALQKERDTAIEALLDAQQKAKLATARAEAAAKKAKAAAEKKAADAKAAAEKADKK